MQRGHTIDRQHILEAIDNNFTICTILEQQRRLVDDLYWKYTGWKYENKTWQWEWISCVHEVLARKEREMADNYQVLWDIYRCWMEDITSSGSDYPTSGIQRLFLMDFDPDEIWEPESISNLQVMLQLKQSNADNDDLWDLYHVLARSSVLDTLSSVSDPIPL
jgi:hypothetical protein